LNASHADHFDAERNGLPREKPMLKVASFIVLCAMAAAAAAEIQSETFVIPANRDGREATVKVPVGAVAAFSANRAVPLTDFSDPQVEAMRLSGDVLIHVTGSAVPIQIKADSVVLELTANDAPSKTDDMPWHTRVSRQLRSTRVIVNGDENQTFVGDVEFTVPTPAGAMQIRADRVERVAGFSAGV
jgi:hypothetical protein